MFEIYTYILSVISAFHPISNIFFTVVEMVHVHMFNWDFYMFFVPFDNFYLHGGNTSWWKAANLDLWLVLIAFEKWVASYLYINKSMSDQVSLYVPRLDFPRRWLSEFCNSFAQKYINIMQYADWKSKVMLYTIKFFSSSKIAGWIR